MTKTMQGFTFFEVLIAVLVIGILAAIAYPNYVHFIVTARRADARIALIENQNLLEKCYAQNFSYVQTCTYLPKFPHSSPQNYYQMTLTNLNKHTYTLTAIPIGSQVNDTTCARITVDQTNNRAAYDSEGATTTIC